MGMRPPPTTSKSQRQGSGFQGSPVEAKQRSEDRSWALTGASPSCRRERMSVGDTPSCWMRWSSTRAQRRSGPG